MPEEVRRAFAAASRRADGQASAGPGGTGPESYGGDRVSLALRPIDEEIIAAVAGTNPSTVVAVVAAGAVLMESWRAHVPALVMMWYAGMEGGHALADVLTGVHNPSGRLPFAIPVSEAHLPFFDRDATAITYDRFHGQRLLDHLGVPAAYPHGFGLSYSTFAIRAARTDAVGDSEVRLIVDVANTGGADGGHVVQAYARATTGPYAGESMLVGFVPVFVPAGATVSVPLTMSLLPLAHWESGSRTRVVPAPAHVEVEVGAHAHDPDSLRLRLVAD